MWNIIYKRFLSVFWRANYEYTRELGRERTGVFESLCSPQQRVERKGKTRGGVRHPYRVSKRQGPDFALQGISASEGQDTGFSGTPVEITTETRLTHTLEVSQTARTVAKALRLNEDLVEAIALGHDLGHTPFGHAGESGAGYSLNPHGLRSL